MEKLFEYIYEFSKEARPMYRFAKRKHDETGAVRRSTGEPYWKHPEIVARFAMKYGGTETEIKAALAHDTLEDTGTTEEDIAEKFGNKVLSIVKEITNDPIRVKDLGKEMYINLELVSISKSALFVKLCDILSNSIDNPRPDQAERMKRNIDYLIANRSQIDNREMKLIDLIIKVLSGRGEK